MQMNEWSRGDRRHRGKVGAVSLLMLQVAGLSLLSSPRAWAIATISGGGAELETQTAIFGGSDPEACECSDSAEIRFPAAGDKPSTATLGCPACSHTVIGANNQPITGFVGATQLTASYTGGAQSLEFRTTATGGADSTVLRPTNSCNSGGSISFTVSGQSEAVAISASISVSGGDSAGSVRLLRDGMEIGTITADHNGTHGSISGGTLQPGRYLLDVGVSGSADPSNPGGFSYNVSMSVSTTPAADIHWINPAGGDFNKTTNWDPQLVPAFSDTAVFDLTGSALPIQIHATNNAVGRWIIRHMAVGLDGPAQVLGTATDAFKFVVDDGGTLFLDDGAAFSTNDGVVGNLKGTESRVFVSGAQTKWTVAAGPLAIGFRAPGRVAVDRDGVLDAKKSISVGETFAGTLDVAGGGHVTTPKLTLNQGSVQVRGRGAVGGSLVEIAGDLDIGGEGGSGSVTIEDGGGITAQKVLVGDRAATGGETVTISGVDSTLGADGELQVAGNAATQIEVKDGAALSTAGKANVGNNLAVGKVIVHGKSGNTSSRWEADDDVFVGGQITPSELIVEDGGHVAGSNSKQMVLGLKTSDIGSASVSVHGSQLDVGTLVVGRLGHGELAISGGALVKSTRGIVGFSQLDPAQGGGTGTGLVTIDGSVFSSFASIWHVTGDCFVGVDEPGTVKLKGSFDFAEAAELLVDGKLTVETLGKILGSGTLTAAQVVNNGTIEPGFSPGVIVIDGDYEQAPDGGLRIEAAGLEPEQFDVLHITGNATLAGEIQFRFIDGYLPKASDSFDFLQVDGTIDGTFERITFPNIAPGFDADITVTADGNLRLTARSDAVPLCAGDCDSSGAVTVNELIVLVNVALGTGPLAQCEIGDGDGDRQISIDEIIIAVRNALAGCLSDH